MSESGGGVAFPNLAQVLILANGLKVKILGHRGEGATDSAFSQERDMQERRLRYPENTVVSQRQCLLQGANGFELDAIQTKDNQVVCTHADEVSQHILVPYKASEKYIGRMQLYQVREIPVGVQGVGRIATLADTFSMVKNEFPGAIINVELKGKIDNKEDDYRTSPSLCECVLNTIDLGQFPMENIIFSSFSHRYLMEMATLRPNANLGMLYDGPSYDQEPLYIGAEDFRDYCTAYSEAALERTLTEMPNLFSIHPEISTVTETMLQLVKEKNLQLYCWASREVSPHGMQPSKQAYAKTLLHVVKLAKEAGLNEIAFITDHVEAVHHLLLTSS